MGDLMVRGEWWGDVQEITERGLGGGKRVAYVVVVWTLKLLMFCGRFP